MASQRKVSPLTYAGTDVHDKILEQFRIQSIRQGKIELKSKIDYSYFRDNGFSVEKSIKDANGSSVKVMDERKQKLMISKPDFVDYKDDLIADIKTVHLRTPPNEGGIFVTEIMDVEKINIPNNYENATDKLYEEAMKKTTKKYNSQFKRYEEAYVKATGREPDLYVYPIIYAPTKHELILNDEDSKRIHRKRHPTYVGKIKPQ